ncbi:16S rRNA (cytidine(1402)-2'-O)-methyltransferase [Porphyromonas macacae]|uniref:16S rRNA (cytidine(1402)-2'-O)-methyltransferase n=1 Tax=Porphyromonas macacae TaxID=28115 RepID=UPI00359F63AC
MSKLTVVPTPVGNLEDITLRALRVLRECDLILAEDTRTSSVLLNHYEIKKPMLSHHKFNEHRTADAIVRRIAAGEWVALVSDAGTPGISDPGFMLVRACLEQGVEVECLPGATAFVPALVMSGLPADRFFFEGFLPMKKGRRTRLEELARMQCTVILYESPFRIVKTLTQLIEHFGDDCPIAACREISKLHEEAVRGTLKEVLKHFEETVPKGEFVLIIGRSLIFDK